MEQAGGAGELLNALGLWKEAVGGGAPWATDQRGGMGLAPLGFFRFTIPWTEGPGGLQSMGSLGVGHD